jgi:hypothetical protein
LRSSTTAEPQPHYPGNPIASPPLARAWAVTKTKPREQLTENPLEALPSND